MSRATAETVAAWATAVGIGLLAFMITWLIGNRIADLIWDRATGPVVALGTASLAGAIMTILAGRRMRPRRFRAPRRGS